MTELCHVVSSDPPLTEGMWECDAIQSLLSGEISFAPKFLVYYIYNHKDGPEESRKESFEITKDEHMEVLDCSRN